MTGVTHSRALGDAAPPMLFDERELPRLTERSAALHAKLSAERDIYIKGLQREKIKRRDRELWQKKLRELTLALLRIEARWTS